MRDFVVDASTIISLSGSCLIEVFGLLTKKERVRFHVPSSVVKEAVTVPMGIKRFELNALRIQNALDSGALNEAMLPPETREVCAELEKAANQAFSSKGKPIRILHRGEAETLAIMTQLKTSLLCLDERTTRLLLETPSALKSLLSRRLHVKVEMHQQPLRRLAHLLPETHVVRSTELLAWAHTQGLLKELVGVDPASLEAALYAVKYRGCAVSKQEISSYLHSLKK